MNQTPKPARAKHGMQRIQEERQRQVSVERWTPKHDDNHDEGELRRAAKCYEATGDAVSAKKRIALAVPSKWPWASKWWKPSASAERNWEKAGALYQAEADRLTRAGQHAEARECEIQVERMAAKLDQPGGTAVREAQS